MKFSLITAALLALCTLAGCSHGTSQEPTDTSLGTYLTVHFSHENSIIPRAILPDIPAPEDFDGISLSGTRTDKDGTVEQKWTAVHDMETALIPIEEVDDDTFAQKVLGDGIAIIPENGNIYAPFDADGTEAVPHVLIYKDGGVTLDMTLISLR